MSLLVEHDNKAVVTDGNGEVLRQLEKPVKAKSGRWKSISDILTYCTKKEAVKAAELMGISPQNVEQVKAPMGFNPWAIKYDFRYEYYYACWDV